MKVIKPQLVKIKNPDTGEFENLNGYVKDQETITVDQELNYQSTNPVSSKGVYNYTNINHLRRIDFLRNMLCSTTNEYAVTYETTNENNLYKENGKYIHYEKNEKVLSDDKSIVSIKISLNSVMYIRFISNYARCPYVVLDINNNVIDYKFDESINSTTKESCSNEYINSSNGYTLILNMIPNDNCIVTYKQTLVPKVDSGKIEDLGKNINNTNTRVEMYKSMTDGAVDKINAKLNKVITDLFNYNNVQYLATVQNINRFLIK